MARRRQVCHGRARSGAAVWDRAAQLSWTEVRPVDTTPARSTNDKHSLAYMEMRLILARLLYNFDFTLSEPGRDWIDDQRCFGLWEKVPLMMNVVPVGKI